MFERNGKLTVRWLKFFSMAYTSSGVVRESSWSFVV